MHARSVDYATVTGATQLSCRSVQTVALSVADRFQPPRAQASGCGLRVAHLDAHELTLVVSGAARGGLITLLLETEASASATLLRLVATRHRLDRARTRPQSPSLNGRSERAIFERFCGELQAALAQRDARSFLDLPR